MYVAIKITVEEQYYLQDYSKSVITSTLRLLLKTSIRAFAYRRYVKAEMQQLVCLYLNTQLFIRLLRFLQIALGFKPTRRYVLVYSSSLLAYIDQPRDNIQLLLILILVAIVAVVAIVVVVLGAFGKVSVGFVEGLFGQYQSAVSIQSNELVGEFTRDISSSSRILLLTEDLIRVGLYCYIYILCIEDSLNARKYML